MRRCRWRVSAAAMTGTIAVSVAACAVGQPPSPPAPGVRIVRPAAEPRSRPAPVRQAVRVVPRGERARRRRGGLPALSQAPRLRRRHLPARLDLGAGPDRRGPLPDDLARHAGLGHALVEPSVRGGALGTRPLRQDVRVRAARGSPRGRADGRAHRGAGTEPAYRLIRSGVQGGSNVSVTSTWSTPGTPSTAVRTQSGITSWIGQPGAVSVIVIATAPFRTRTS